MRTGGTGATNGTGGSMMKGRAPIRLTNRLSTRSALEMIDGQPGRLTLPVRAAAPQARVNPAQSGNPVPPRRGLRRDGDCPRSLPACESRVDW